jgi:hypothetical protein
MNREKARRRTGGPFVQATVDAACGRDVNRAVSGREVMRVASYYLLRSSTTMPVLLMLFTRSTVPVFGTFTLFHSAW